MEKTLHPEFVYCVECGKEILYSSLTKAKKDVYRRSGNAYCSEECKKEFLRKLFSKTMKKTNEKYASERMKRNNPMKNPESLEKMKNTLKEINYKPLIRGGNGTGSTKPQQILFDYLKEINLNPHLEYVIKTNVKKINPDHLPTHYKIDIAIPDYKIAIEIDGNSHNLISRKEQDLKKDNFLKLIDWTVLRFKNKDILDDLENCKKIIASQISKLSA